MSEGCGGPASHPRPSGPRHTDPGGTRSREGGTPAARSDAPGSRSHRRRRPSRRRRLRALPHRRMPRAPSAGLSLLILMASLAFVAATSPFHTFDPWLSASDLHSASAAADPRPACLAPEPLSTCPPPCPANSTKSTQCLYYLEESHKEEVCGRLDLGPERRRDVLHGLRMRYCCEHAVDAALPPAALRGGNVCRRFLAALIEVDHLAKRLSCNHHNLLTRYDCSQNYSIAHHCKDCKEAYRRWVCSTLVPHYTRAGVRVRPCLSVCEDVEQHCPYLLPDQTVSPGEAAHPTPQYAGEPTFLCLDPNIPESDQQRLKSSHGDEDCCYTHCGSPGRGVPADGRGGDIDVSGGGGQRSPQVLGVCEHCPGRPPNDPANYYRAGSQPRTLNKVLLLWTAWLTLTQTDRRIYYYTIHCLLVSCAVSVRTTICWLKNKWRHSCS